MRITLTIMLLLSAESTHLVQEPSSIQKIAEIDQHIGVAMSGLTADAKTLIDRARVETQVRATPPSSTWNSIMMAWQVRSKHRVARLTIAVVAAAT